MTIIYQRTLIRGTCRQPTRGFLTWRACKCIGLFERTWLQTIIRRPPICLNDKVGSKPNRGFQARRSKMTCHPLNICLYNLEGQTSIPSERRSQGWNPTAHKDFSDGAHYSSYALYLKHTKGVRSLEQQAGEGQYQRNVYLTCLHSCSFQVALQAESTSVRKAAKHLSQQTEKLIS